MKLLQQKHHGLPGLGIEGNVGKNGINGRNIYFGKIDDFFDGENVNVNTIVKVALRQMSDTDKEIYNQLIKKFIETAKTSINNSEMPSENIASAISEQPLYYSGAILDNVAANNIIKSDNFGIYNFDIDNNYYRMVQLLSNTPDIHDTYNNGSENYIFPYCNITNVSINTEEGISKEHIPYTKLYNYSTDSKYVTLQTNISFGSFNKEGKNIRITFSVEDVAILENKFKEYYPYDKALLSDSSIYTLLNEQSVNIPEQISEDKFLSYILHTVNSSNGYKYATDVNDSYTELIKKSDETYTLNTSLYDVNTYKYINLQELKAISNNQPNAAFFDKIALELQLSNETVDLYSKELLLNNNTFYYGIDTSILYSQPKTEAREKTEIIDLISNPNLTNLTEFNDYLINVKTIATNDINRTDPETGTIDNNVYYAISGDNDNNIKISTTLSEKYKEGDIIYFHINEADNINNNIPYMVIITKDLYKCSKQQLIDNAQLTNPLSIKYISEYFNDRILTNKVGILNDIIDSSVHIITDERTKRNLLGLTNSDSMLNIIDYNKNFMSSIAVNPYMNNNFMLNVKSSSNTTTITGKTLKLNNLYIKKDNLYDTNVECKDALYNDNIIMADGYVYPITNMILYNDNNFAYLAARMNISDYLYNYTSDNCIYGYEIYNKNGQMVQSNCTTNDYIDIVLTLDDVQRNNSSIDNYILQNTISFTNNSSLILDWDDIEYNFETIIYIGNTLYAVYVSNRVGRIDTEHAVKVFLSLKDKKIYTFATQNRKNGTFYYEELNSLIYDDNHHIKEINKEPVSGHKTSHKNLKLLTACYNNNIAIVYNNDICINKTLNSKQYYIFAYVIYNGIKLYSKCTQLKAFIDINNMLTDYNIELLGDTENLFTETNNNISFSTTNITVEENKDVSLYICPNSDDVSIKEIRINNIPINSSYSESWINIEKVDSSTETYIINTSNNIPTITVTHKNSDDTIDTSSYNFNSIDELITSLCDKETETEKAEDCDLFKYINDNSIERKDTKNRSAVVSVIYTLGESSETHCEQYTISQPGFKDLRIVPNFNLTLHNNIEDVQSYNTVENGIYCNQFKTYLDIDITNFMDTWCTMLPNNSTIKLDFEIENISSDPIWMNEYIVQDQVYLRNTFNILADSSIFSTLTNNDYSNYINLNVSGDDIIVDSSIIVNNGNSQMPIDENNVINYNNNEYVILNKDVMANYSKPNRINYGLYNKFTIKNNIDINTDKKLSAQINLEFGNPILANLYLRFAVKKVRITYTNPELKTYTFTAAISELQPDTSCYLMSLSKTYIETYKFISDRLDAMINPLSYIVCPESEDRQLNKVCGDIYKVGSDSLIKKYVGFYCKSIYSDNNINKSLNDIRSGKFINWKQLLVKEKYLQDNIQNFAIKSIDTENKLTYELLSDNQYLSLIYNSVLFNAKQRNGIYTFYYNSNEYPKSKYDQINNNYPVLANQNILLPVRDKKLIDSMDVWNDLYLDTNKASTDITFTGILSQYSNGYNYLNIDETSYLNSGVMPLEEVKEQNNKYIYNLESTEDVNIKPFTSKAPDQLGYFRTLLYNIMWEYPEYIGDNKIIPYKLVNGFDYLVLNLDKESEYKDDNYTDYINKLKEFCQHDTEDKYYVKPYYKYFDLYPRIACNTDFNKQLNIFMLRKPTIGGDSDNIKYSLNNYQLQNRFIEFTGDVKQLKIPYIVTL